VTPQHRMRGDVAVLVVAAGSGVRLGPGAPKALRSLRGEPLLVHAVRRVTRAACVGQVVVAAPAGMVDAVEALLAPVSGCPVTVIAGGSTRQASVAAALAAVPAGYGIVLVHDAARALTPTRLIERVADAVRAGHDAVIPVLPVVDTIKRVDADGAVITTVDRADLRVVQTPQGFRRAVLAAAHRAAVAGHDRTDDAGLVELAGVPVWTVPGEEAALKITRPLDLAIGAALLDSAPD